MHMLSPALSPSISLLYKTLCLSCSNMALFGLRHVAFWDIFFACWHEAGTFAFLCLFILPHLSVTFLHPAFYIPSTLPHFFSSFVASAFLHGVHVLRHDLCRRTFSGTGRQGRQDNETDLHDKTGAWHAASLTCSVVVGVCALGLPTPPPPPPWRRRCQPPSGTTTTISGLIPFFGRAF